MRLSHSVVANRNRRQQAIGRVTKAGSWNLFVPGAIVPRSCIKIGDCGARLDIRYHWASKGGTECYKN